MRVLSKASLILGLSVLSVAPTAFGQTTTNRQITVDVVPLVSTVTYRTAATDPYVVGYNITVKNTGSSTLQNVTVFGVTSVVGTTSTYTSDFQSIQYASGSKCEEGSTKQEAKCTVAQMAGGATVVVPVFFKAPVLPLDTAEGAYKVKFSKGSPASCWNECKNDNSGSADNDTAFEWDSYPADVSLGTTNFSVIESALAPEGGTFSTGTGLVTDLGDKFAIQVEVPGQEKFSTIKLNEGVADSVQCTATKNFVTCLNAEVTIDGVAYSQTGTAWLIIKVQIDGANLLPSFKPNRVAILYQPGLKGNPWYANTACPLDSNNKPRALTEQDGLGYSTMPCLATTESIGGSKGKDKTMPTYVYTFLSRHNGGFAFF